VPFEASCDNIRIANFAAPLSRDGPGLLLRDINKSDPQITSIIDVIVANAPDLIVLTDIDHDHDWHALRAFQNALKDAGRDLPYVFTQSVNAGLPSGEDFDRDGRFGEPEDAHGWGRFHGDGGLAVLSAWSLEAYAMKDLSETLWKDLPNATLPSFKGQRHLNNQRLSPTGHWILPANINGKLIDLMIYTATPPVFDGPEDANGLRNRDELRMWEQVIASPRDNPFVIIGNANLDPYDGDGITQAMRDFLQNPAITDPEPRSTGGQIAADENQTGDPSLDTADWPNNEPGNLRVSYVLPSADLKVLDAGVFWPAPDDPLHDLLGEDGLAAGPHRLVWVDIGW
jgi:hypothetical protein